MASEKEKKRKERKKRACEVRYREGSAHVWSTSFVLGSTG